jgi:hypothetical protein
MKVTLSCGFCGGEELRLIKNIVNNNNLEAVRIYSCLKCKKKISVDYKL